LPGASAESARKLEEDGSASNWCFSTPTLTPALESEAVVRFHAQALLVDSSINDELKKFEIFHCFNAAVLIVARQMQTFLLGLFCSTAFDNLQIR
jgi:hypothetical protein